MISGFGGARASGSRWLIALALLVGMGGPGCRSKSSSARTVTVYAASSLTEVLGALEAPFEAQYPGIDLRFSFGGSQILRHQIASGAPADVFISAHPEHVEALAASGRVEDVRSVARNSLALVVPAEGASITAFDELPGARRVVLGTPEVPIGRYAREALRRVSSDFARRVEAQVVSLEPNTRLVMAKVALGEADAAIVYRSDAMANSQVRLLLIPEKYDVTAEYRGARVLRRGADAAAVSAVLDFLQSDVADESFGKHGFRPRGS